MNAGAFRSLLFPGPAHPRLRTVFPSRLPLVLALLTLFGGPLRAETSDGVLANHRKALGGEAALAKATSIQYSGTLSHAGHTRTFTWSTLNPAFFREETKAGALGDALATDGNRSWARLLNGAVIGLQGPERDDVQMLGVLLSRAYLSPGDADLELGEPASANGGAAWKVPLKGRRVPPMELTFDAKSWHLLSAVHKGSRGDLTVTFDNVQKVGDLRLPHKVTRVVTRDGTRDETVYTIEKVDRKAELQDTLFERPGEPGGAFRLENGQSRVNVPFKLSPTQHILVEATINGGAKGWYLLDSGAQMSVLDAAVASQLALPVLDKVVASGTGGTTTLPVHPVQKVNIGGLELDNTAMASMDLSPFTAIIGTPLAGILGLEVFDRLVVELRYAEGVVRFHNPAAFNDAGTGEALPVDDFGRVNVLVNGQTLLSVVLDTGSGAALNIAPALAKREKLEPPETRRIPMTAAGVGGQQTAYIGLLESVQLGQLAVPKVTVVFHEGTTGVMAGDDGLSVLGNLLLQRFNVTFDLPRRQVIVEQGPWFSKPFSYNRSGLTFKSGGLVVEKVSDPTIGLQAGDELISVATEQGAWSTDRAVIEARLKEGAGTKVKVKFRRGKKEQEKELVLRDLL